MFYEIFKFLEENVSPEILPAEYYRTQQFESDIEFYKGSDWLKTYKIRPSVQKYLNHLFDVKEKNPLLLIAYVYHLYMGLLSGGQILAKKRSVATKFRNTFSEQRADDDNIVQPGSHLTSYPNKSIFELKNNLREKINEFARTFHDHDLRDQLVAESKKVFELNNLVINSVEGVGPQLRKNFESFLGYFLVASIALYFLVKFLF